MGCGISKKFITMFTLTTTITSTTTTNQNGIANNSILPFKFTINFLVFILLFAVGTIKADSDWIQDCGACHCHWNSGKKTADCKNRSITTIPTEFNSELQVLDLSNNQIPELRREQFIDANLPNLHKIFMKNCTLQEVNRDALKGLAILFELDLSNNQIKLLTVGIFTDLVKLRNLIMNNNEIEILENNLFRDLKFLSRVEFKNNRIKTVEQNAFINLPSLSLIYLVSNRLSNLKRETFEKIPKLKHLNLAQNPWNCTCELQAFRDYAISENLYTPPTDCHEPLNLRGKLWTDIPTDHFACRPRILEPRNTGKYVEAASENVTLICRIQANPKPDILWMFNKRPIKTNERLHISKPFEDNNIHDHRNEIISELIIFGVRASDRGAYTCVAENRGGKDESDIQLSVNFERFLEVGGVAGTDSTSNLLLIICIVALTLLLLLIVILLVLCWYCRRIRHYSKDSTMSEHGLITSKVMDKTQNGSVLEGSVIMEMQKSLLTEVNPVEKPPRRTEIDSVDTDDGHEIKKTLLDETPFGSNDDETNSVTLSDTTPRSRATFVDDGYGTTLPPDLLSFPAHQRVPQSPSLQSSISNIPDNRTLYGKSPLSSPVYQHVIIPNGLHHNNIYGQTQSGFRTLQHPKSRNLAIAAARNQQQQQQQQQQHQLHQSPFLPAPVVYTPVIMKQGYMTIPRKPRVPSWTPSVSTTLSEFQTTSPTSPITSNSMNGTDSNDDTISLATVAIEPVYDNLGLRTTAGGNSVLNLNKIGISSTSGGNSGSMNSTSSANNKQLQQQIRYTMKDRPLPATPNNHLNSLTNGGNISIGNSNNLSNYHHQNGNNGNNGSNNSYNKNGGANNSTKIYEPIHELGNNLTTTSDTEPLYGTARNHSGLTIVPSIQNLNTINLNNNNNNNNNINKTVKIPPRPPPKPKKKMSVISTGQDGGSTSQLCYEDEGEDGTEV